MSFSQNFLNDNNFNKIIAYTIDEYHLEIDDKIK